VTERDTGIEIRQEREKEGERQTETVPHRQGLNHSGCHEWPVTQQI